MNGYLLARAVLVLDADNKVTTQYLDNINSEPNYDACTAVINALDERGLRPLFHCYKIR